MRRSGHKVAQEANTFRSTTGIADDAVNDDKIGVALGLAGMAGIPGADELSAAKELIEASNAALEEGKKEQAEWNAYCEEQWRIFWQRHQKIKVAK